MRHLSPLRYPGGKAKLAPFFTRLITSQEHRPIAYAEPFAGGAGAALRLLVDGSVKEIYINDINPGVAAFWRSLFQTPSDFKRRLAEVDVTVDQWRVQREIYLHPDGQTDLDLGFATFFLNRANRSGILLARPIGGLQQEGNWKIDARFNKPALIERVTALSAFAGQVHLTELDALDFLRSIEHRGDDVLAYVDPPYLVQGDYLYLDAFDAEAHRRLSELLAQIEIPWVLTYDADPRITEDLYKGQRCAQFGISHTAQVQHVGAEFVVFGPTLELPDMQITLRSEAVWV